MGRPTFGTKKKGRRKQTLKGVRIFVSLADNFIGLPALGARETPSANKRRKKEEKKEEKQRKRRRGKKKEKNTCSELYCADRFPRGFYFYMAKFWFNLWNSVNPDQQF